MFLRPSCFRWTGQRAAVDVILEEGALLKPQPFPAQGRGYVVVVAVAVVIADAVRYVVGGVVVVAPTVAEAVAVGGGVLYDASVVAGAVRVLERTRGVFSCGGRGESRRCIA